MLVPAYHGSEDKQFYCNARHVIYSLNVEPPYDWVSVLNPIPRPVSQQFQQQALRRFLLCHLKPEEG